MNDKHIQKLSEMKTVLEEAIVIQENNAPLSQELFKNLRKLSSAYAFIFSEIKPNMRHKFVEYRLMRSVSKEYVPGYGLEHFASCYKIIHEMPDEQLRGTMWRLFVPHFQATLTYEETFGDVPEVFLKMCKEFIVAIDELIEICKTQEPQEREERMTATKFGMIFNEKYRDMKGKVEDNRGLKKLLQELANDSEHRFDDFVRTRQTQEPQQNEPPNDEIQSLKGVASRILKSSGLTNDTI